VKTQNSIEKYHQGQPGTTMLNDTEKKNLETCRIVIQEIFDGTPDYSKLPECYSESEFRNEDPAHGRVATYEDLRPMLEYYEQAFSGYRSETVDMIARDDMVFIHWKISGTHSGEFMGYAPTGNAFQIDAMSKCKLKAGKIVDVAQIHDLYGMFQQLGLLQSVPTGDSLQVLEKIDKDGADRKQDSNI